MRPLTWHELWACVFMLWLIIIAVLWLVARLSKQYPNGEEKAMREAGMRAFEKDLQRDKDKAFLFLGKSTL